MRTRKPESFYFFTWKDKLPVDPWQPLRLSGKSEYFLKKHNSNLNGLSFTIKLGKEMRLKLQSILVLTRKQFTNGSTGLTKEILLLLRSNLEPQTRPGNVISHSYKEFVSETFENSIFAGER